MAKTSLALPYDQVWMIAPHALSQFIATVADASVRFADFDSSPPPPIDESDKPIGYTLAGDTARIPIKGPILKTVPPIFRFFGIEAAATTEIGAALAGAMEDPRVKSIRLDIDSPGGTVAGVAELATAIRKARSKKPIEASAPDMIASAAYWLGSQASNVVVGPAAAIGSIGTYAVIADLSDAAAAKGIKIHVVSSGPLKGAGVPGTQVTPAQLGDMQRRVDKLTDLFVADIAKGRSLGDRRMTKAQARALATGEIWTGDEAIEQGLVDRVSAIDFVDNAPSGAESESAMTAEEIAGLVARCDDQAKKIADLETEISGKVEALQAAEAREKAQAESLEAARAAQIESVIEANRDRIPAASVEHVRAYAATCADDPKRFADFVASLPVITRAEPVGETPADSNQEDHKPEITAQQAMVCTWLGISHEDYMRFGADIGGK